MFIKMKSFALYLIIIFIVGVQYQEIIDYRAAFCSSLSASSSSTVRSTTTAAPSGITKTVSSSSAQRIKKQITPSTFVTSSSSSSKSQLLSSSSSSVTASTHPIIATTTPSSSRRGLGMGTTTRRRSTAAYDLYNSSFGRKTSNSSNSINNSNNNNNNNISNISNNSSASFNSNLHSSSNKLGAQSNGYQNHQQTSTTKTPRMIQRRVAGHLQYTRIPKSHEEQQIINRSNNNKSNSNSHWNNKTNSSANNNNVSTATQLSRLYFRRKDHQEVTNDNRNDYNSSSVNTFQDNNNIFKKAHADAEDVADLNDDAALLEDPKDSDNWDNGILRLSAGAGKEDQIKSSSKKKDDSKKTLSDQVKEGKYGLIEKEIFGKEPQRPGIISYLPNKDVPDDNIHNLGGLNEDDIWLAEDHLLVLKGGGLNDKDLEEPWEPIDDYQAPSRQIKIPSNPKIPPPFPVQFEDNGPIQFIGNNKFPFFNPVTNETLQFLPGNGYLPPETISDNEKNLLTRSGQIKNLTNSKGGYFYPAPFPSWNFGGSNNETFINPFLNFPPSLPPIGNIGIGLLDSSNGTNDYIDEDDPSLYYPPAYSFVYKSNYTSPVGPGPLVPGIVLPPPPSAFARLEDSNESAKSNTKEIPFKQILTKIQEYTPKTIDLTTLGSPPISTTPSTPLLPVTTTTLKTTSSPLPLPTPTPPPTKQIVFAVTPQPPTRTTAPVRIYTTPKQFHQPTPPAQDVVQFIPKVPQSSSGLSKGNPIYYEYFDARKIPTSTTSTPPPAVQYSQSPSRPSQHTEPIYFKDNAKPTQAIRGHKKGPITVVQPIQQSYQQKIPTPNKGYLPTRPAFNYEEYIYITPKPEIRPNGIPDTFIPVLVKSNYKPIENFEREIDVIRQTLQFYKSKHQHQQHQESYPTSRPQKSKAVYEYSFDATKSNRNFNSPVEFDSEPFKPMVKYNRPVDDADGFKAMAYSKSDEIPNSAVIIQPNSNQNSDTTAIPILSSPTPKTRTGAKAYYQSVLLQGNSQRTQSQLYFPSQGYHQQQQQQPQDYSNNPWVSIEKQILQEIIPQNGNTGANKHRQVPNFVKIADPSTNHQYGGYFYKIPTTTKSKQNNRYQLFNQDEIGGQLSAIKAQLNQYERPPPPSPPLPFISLENDTYINYSPFRPPINPDAEFINPQRPEQGGRRKPQQPLDRYNTYRHETLSAIINQAQRLPPPPPGAPPQGSRVPYQPIDLDRDILINYRFPLPASNPDSEYVESPAVNSVVNKRHPQHASSSSGNPRQQQSSISGGSKQYHQPIQYRLPGDQSEVYYLTPRDVRLKKS